MELARVLRALAAGARASPPLLDALLRRLGPAGLLRSPDLLAWIVESTSRWDANKYVKSFVLKLTALLTEQEDLFQKLSQDNVYRNIFQFCGLDENDPSLKLGVLKILLAMTHHRAGLQFILERNRWEDVIKYCYQNQTIYFSRLGVTFISSLVWRLNDEKFEDKCDEVMLQVLTPLLDNQWKNTTVIDDENSSLMDSALSPTLGIILSILDDVEHFGKSNAVAKSIVAHDLEWHLWNLFQLCRKPSLLVTVAKSLLLAKFSKVYVAKGEDEEFSQRDVLNCCLINGNLISALISKRDILGVVGLTSFCFTYVCKVRDFHKISLTVEKDNGSFDFANQVIVMSFIPMLCTSKIYRSEFVDLYIEKLISMTCEHTTRLAYSFRDLIKEKNDTLFAVKAVQSTVALKKYLTKSQAITIFQSYYYKLQDYVPDNEDENDYVVVGVDGWEATLLISTLLDAIYIYIDEFDIPWQDTVEVLCVYNFCTRIIKTSNLETKLTIRAFKLAQLTIKRFLSPNLALLVNSAHGSVIEEIGRIIYEKLHDPCWDIRDSAMELLYIVTDVAEFKFPAFQQQITDNNLPELVLILAMEDSESYVRASALRCISIMVRIQIIWEKHLQNLELPEKMMNLLHQESEGLVRKEAAEVLVNIYEYQKFSAALLDNIFLTMFHSAAEDLHWEVQITALQFWKKVITNQMSHQGMIDGIFPSVTFSKENRKIVHLTEKEIRVRLKKILNELALRGCLGVLLSCMKDESEIDVMEKALQIIDEIIGLLDKYNMNEVNSIEDESAKMSRPVFDEGFLKNDVEIAKIGSYRNKADVRSETNNIILNGGQNSDNVIESIVNSDDVNLLANVYANQLKVNADAAGQGSEPKMRNNVKNISNMFVEPELFISTVRGTDFKKIISDKKKWALDISNDIKSLFDDILSYYSAASDVNSMDCY